MKGKESRFGVLAAQCAVCAVAVLAALTLRFVGGNTFEQLRDRFHTAIQDDALGAALMERWQNLEFV